MAQVSLNLFSRRLEAEATLTHPLTAALRAFQCFLTQLSLFLPNLLCHKNGKQQKRKGEYDPRKTESNHNPR
jgi:hypothetical protein